MASRMDRQGKRQIRRAFRCGTKPTERQNRDTGVLLSVTHVLNVYGRRWITLAQSEIMFVFEVSDINTCENVNFGRLDNSVTLT